MVLVDAPLNRLDHIYLIESNMFLLMEIIQTYFQLLVGATRFGTGPISFPYINDLPNASKKFTVYLFADDTNIYHECNDLPNLIKVVNKELRSVA